MAPSEPDAAGDDLEVTFDDFEAAADRLAASYSAVPRPEITALLRQADVTVTRLTGIQDPATAEDLTHLRLDVRHRPII